METLFIYIVKVNIALTVFYLLYMLLFSKDTFIRLRRYYFLSAIIFSLSYPLFTVSALGSMFDWKEEPVATETSVYIGEISTGEWIVDDVEEVATPIDWTIVAKNILLVGTLFLSLRLLWQLFSIVRIKSHSEKRSLFGYLFYHLKDMITPFSFFNWIFVNSESHNEKELKQILLHEHTHARQWHSLDILLVEMLRIAFWWNPVVWLMKRDMAINLEYLADQAVIEEGVESTEYQYHLLQLTNHETAVQIVNNFNVSQLKQRIIMMNRNKTPMRKLAKYLSVLPLALLLITANSVYAQQNEPTQEPIEIKDKDANEKSRFHQVTENLDKLADILKSEVNYPQVAKERRIEGDVIVSFIIEVDGSTINPKVEIGEFPALNQEALRVINSMPKLTQFMYTEDGEPLRIKYNSHFNFRLDGEKASFDVAMRGYSVLTIADKTGEDKPLFIVDGVKMDKEFDMSKIDRSDVEHRTIYQKEAAIATYGEEGKNGAVMITTKKKMKSPQEPVKEDEVVV
ncbi:MAG: TonB family protein, partial [Bacteroidales bacterium]|nr:TonB family protein [Bacteroidales bacterium]